MLLCLSSGFTPRYREDILRATAMPMGNSLRFRYELPLISENLLNKFKNCYLKGESVCIAYLDRSDSTCAPTIIPCRIGTLLKSEVCGNFCILDFKLGAFGITRDVQAFNDEILGEAEQLPYWDGGKIRGYFCQSLKSEPTSLITSFEISDWQHLIVTLKKQSDFLGESFFYYVQGVFPSGVERTKAT
jgi:hypothetical protein